MSCAEIGLDVVGEPPHLWHQEVVAEGHATGYAGVINDYYLIRVDAFTVDAEMTEADPTNEVRSHFTPFWYLMVGADPRQDSIAAERALLGYLSVQDPRAFDEVRRPSDPTDLRISDIWVHPNTRGAGIGKALGLVAKAHSLFESHSPSRSAAGTSWANSIGDFPPPAEEAVDAAAFERGGRKSYAAILLLHPDLTGLPFPDES